MFSLVCDAVGWMVKGAAASVCVWARASCVVLSLSWPEYSLRVVLVTGEQNHPAGMCRFQHMRGDFRKNGEWNWCDMDALYLRVYDRESFVCWAGHTERRHMSFLAVNASIIGPHGAKDIFDHVRKTL